MNSEILDGSTFEISSKVTLRVEVEKMKLSDQSPVYNTLLHFKEYGFNHVQVHSINAVSQETAQGILEAFRKAMP